MDTITLINGRGESKEIDKEHYEILKKSGMLWEFYPDAPMTWPHKSMKKKKKVLNNPSFGNLFDLILDLNQKGIDLINYPHEIEYNPDVFNRYKITIKCRGIECKSKEIIGVGEADTQRKAGMLALLRANGWEINYTK